MPGSGKKKKKKKNPQFCTPRDGNRTAEQRNDKGKKIYKKQIYPCVYNKNEVNDFSAPRRGFQKAP